MDLHQMPSPIPHLMPQKESHWGRHWGLLSTLNVEHAIKSRIASALLWVLLLWVFCLLVLIHTVKDCS